MTNADTIRSMSDLDLAFFLTNMFGGDPDMVLGWLQLPADRPTE